MWKLRGVAPMAEEPVMFSELLAGYGTTTIGDDADVESAFALLKIRDEDGRAAWSVRSGGARLTSEELLGVLEGLVTSIRQKLTKSWKPTTEQQEATNSGGKGLYDAVQFSELLSGMETVGVGDGYLIESVFAVIKARRVDGVGVWHVRSAEMKMSSEEQLGALEGYAAALRQELAASWNW